jgi:hypothetical protein
VLDLYVECYDPASPTGCLDQQPVVLHDATRPAKSAAHGRPEQRDYEYVRQGIADLFVRVEPRACWRYGAVTARRTKVDYAEPVRSLADVVYPHTEYIRLVQDQLDTHTLAALYVVFPAAEARRITSCFELHSTPKHGSWLNMAEIEISVFECGSLSWPVAKLATLHAWVDALERERNAAHCTIHWQFPSQQVRSTLADLYPNKETYVDYQQKPTLGSDTAPRAGRRRRAEKVVQRHQTHLHVAWSANFC